VIDIAHLIQSSVAPVFLLSGVAATLGVLTNRLSRIVDRARLLEQQLEGHPGEAAHLHADLGVLARRAHYINVAISLATIAALLVALVVVTLFANAFLGSELALLIALLFVGAMVCLSAAYVAFFIEVRVAVAALRIGLHVGKRAG
jgi:shikimate kinase